MKFYIGGELEAVLQGEAALERCMQCSYCYTLDADHHTCQLDNDGKILEEELENEDDNQIECCIP